MNESDTRLHKIDPQLKAAGWGVVDGSYVTTEYNTMQYDTVLWN